MTQATLVYFIAIPGHAVARFGTGQLLGCRTNRQTGKLEWPREPATISEAEYARYRKEYGGAVRRGELRGPFADQAAAVAALVAATNAAAPESAIAAKAPIPVDSVASKGPDTTGERATQRGGPAKPE